ncbi:MAG: ribosome-associated translation inhibitor RaiA [Pseudomonadota bacterium]
MHLTIRGIHLDVTSSLRRRSEKRLQRVIKSNQAVLEVAVSLSVDNKEHRVLSNCHTRHGSLVAEARGENMYAEIDNRASKLAGQLWHRHSKSADHDHESGGLHPIDSIDQPNDQPNDQQIYRGLESARGEDDEVIDAGAVR